MKVELLPENMLGLSRYRSRKDNITKEIGISSEVPAVQDPEHCGEF